MSCSWGCTVFKKNKILNLISKVSFGIIFSKEKEKKIVSVFSP